MPSSEKKNFRAAAALSSALAAVPLLNLLAFRLAPRPFANTLQTRLTADSAMQTAGFLTLGMRRLAADLDFIDLLMYYGQEEEGGPSQAHENGGGRYPEIKDRSLRIMDLDPYFTYAVLYGAGSLAFNLERQQEAIDLLSRAAAFQPKEWKYRTYTIAIGLKTKGDVAGVIHQLTPVMEDPDCPTQLKNMLAFLNFKTGHREEAIRLYKEILASRDPNYAHIAREMLLRMGAPAEP